MNTARNGLRRRHRAAMAVAAEWFSRMRSPSRPAGLEQEFETWLEADPVHALAYEQCETLWMMAGELRHDEEIEAEIARAREAAESGFAGRGAGAGSTAGGLMAGLGKAAAVALLVAGSVFLAKTIDPDQYSTRVGEQRLLALPDGSTAMLNTNTSVITEYDQQARRIVLLRGEAYFDVKSDPDRAFEVHATGGIVRAVGTAFNVAIRDEGVSVAVMEGTVVIESGARQDRPQQVLAEVELGQAVRLLPGGQVSEIAVADLKRVSAWRDRKIYFKSDRLDVAIAEYNRYTRTKIILKSGHLADQLITGVFNLGDTESFIFALEQAFDVSILRTGDSIQVIDSQPGRHDAWQPGGTRTL